MATFHEQFEAYLKGQDNNISDAVISDAKGDAKARLGIYRDAYALRLIDILYGDFPAVYEILGTQAFIDMARFYLAAYPSTSFTVRHFGQYLAKFLNETPPYADYPYLSQMADFEWAKGTVFDAPDTDILTLEVVGKLPESVWERAVFQFIPAMMRLRYDYDIPQVYRSVTNQKQGNEQSNEPSKLKKPLAWVMWRKDLNPHWYSMSIEEDWFFVQARQGMAFDELCQGLSTWLDNDTAITQRAAQIVRRWIDEKMLIAIG